MDSVGRTQLGRMHCFHAVHCLVAITTEPNLWDTTDFRLGDVSVGILCQREDSAFTSRTKKDRLTTL